MCMTALLVTTRRELAKSVIESHLYQGGVVKLTSYLTVSIAENFDT